MPLRAHKQDHQSAQAPEPLTACRTLLTVFAAAMASFAPWNAERRVAVAVSGGADSMALAWLAAQWGNPLALIVDHGLRSRSGEEAALTRRRLQALGLEARILALNGLQYGPALAARARTARYDRLQHTCREAGLTDLLIGHHRRDQAETRLMREASASGPDGLASMAPIAWRGDVRLIRPLLGVAPGDLRQALLGAGIGWVEDPSNADMRTARARLRAELDDPAGDGDAVRAIAARAAADGWTRAAREQEVAAFLAAHVEPRPEGFALLWAETLAPAALSALLRCVGGLDHPPPTRPVASLARRLRHATLAGVRVMPAGRLGGTVKGAWLFAREARACAAAAACRDGLLWDGRFRLRGRQEALNGLTIGALGDQAPLLRRKSHLPASILRTLPALRRADTLAAVPHLAYPDPGGNGAFTVTFEPRAVLAGAPFHPVRNERGPSGWDQGGWHQGG